MGLRHTEAINLFYVELKMLNLLGSIRKKAVKLQFFGKKNIHFLKVNIIYVLVK
jgi:hypothetical protein